MTGSDDIVHAARPNRAYWEVAAVWGLIPNLFLAGVGLLFGRMAFSPSAMYAAGLPRSTFLTLAAILFGAGALNVLALYRGATRDEPLLHWTAVVASAGLLGWAMWLSMPALESRGLVPGEAVALAAISLSGLWALVRTRSLQCSGRTRTSRMGTDDVQTHP